MKELVMKRNIFPVTALIICAVMLSGFSFRRQKDDTKDLLAGLDKEVEVILFTQKEKGEACLTMEQTIGKLAKSNKKIIVRKMIISEDKAKALVYQIDQVPQVVVKTKEFDPGLKYKGVQSGYHYQPFVEGIVSVSQGKSDLDPKILAEVKKIDKVINVQVIATPTCPYCPQMVRTAQNFAIESKYINVDIINAYEYPYLVNKYKIRGVPTTVINEKIIIPGLVNEETFLAYIKQAIK